MWNKSVCSQWVRMDFNITSRLSYMIVYCDNTTLIYTNHIYLSGNLLFSEHMILEISNFQINENTAYPKTVQQQNNTRFHRTMTGSKNTSIVPLVMHGRCWRDKSHKCHCLVAVVELCVVTSNVHVTTTDHRWCVKIFWQRRTWIVKALSSK